MLSIRLAALLAFSLFATAPGLAAERARHRVEVVFALDTTSSMAGLLEGAKRAVWSIANRIVNGEPTPDVRIGLVAFRDRGDEYVTRVFDLTADVDTIHAQLAGLKAEGGGDGPEHVNQALKDALEKISWTDDSATLRLIVLVGDAPPHDDYQDGLLSTDLAREAKRRGIHLTAIRCGSDRATQDAFSAIANAAAGDYCEVPQDGGDRPASPTPADEPLAVLSIELARTMIGWGTPDEREAHAARAYRAMGLEAAAAAERASFLARATGDDAFGSADLLGALHAGRATLATLSPDALPASLRSLDRAGLATYLESLAARRGRARANALPIAKSRDDTLGVATGAKRSSAPSFESAVTAIIARQGGRVGIAYR